MTWTMLVIGMTGVLSSTPVYLTIPMQNREACTRAAKDLTTDSRGIGIACISSETGEIVRIK